MNDIEVERIAEELVRIHLNQYKANIDGKDVDLIGFRDLSLSLHENWQGNSTFTLYHNGDTPRLRGSIMLKVDSKIEGSIFEERPYNLEVQIKLGEKSSILTLPIFSPR